ncbi:MAG: Esterase EstD [Chlamydiae bacterium]|nr:Esterase EstD [Chlamydiota bacterium]
MEVTVGKETREWVVVENEGNKLFGVLHRPEVENPPVVVVMHGFGSSKIGSNRCWVYLAEALSNAGVATLRFDFRGAGDSEGSLDQLTAGGYVSDALAVTRYLEKEKFDRIGYFGSSFGGAISVIAAALQKKIKSLALWAPVASGELWIRDFLLNNPALASGDLEDILNTYHGVKLNSQFKAEFVQFNASEKVKELSEVPLLHFHGENDQTLTLSHQNAYQKAREGSSAPTRFIIYPDTDHVIGFEPILSEVIEQTVSWFLETL